MFPDDCSSWFSCENGKRSKDLSMEQVWKLMIKEDENGCPALNVTGTLTAEISASIETPLNSVVGDKLIEADNNVDLQADIAAWRAGAGSTFKQISIVNCNSIDKQAVIISYTS